jgi:hypothetical protein
MRPMTICMAVLLLVCNWNCVHQKESMREQLVKGLEASNPSLAAMVKDTTTQLKVKEAPFFHQHQLIYAEKFMPHGPRIAFLALGSTGRVTDVSFNQSAWEGIASADSLRLTDPKDALAYFQLAWEVTTSRSELTYRVASVDEFRFRPNLEADLQAQRDAIVQRQGTVVAPATVAQSGAAFVVTYFQIRNRNLERVRATVQASGAFTQQAELLEADMPTVWGNP